MSKRAPKKRTGLAKLREDAEIPSEELTEGLSNHLTPDEKTRPVTTLEIYRPHKPMGEDGGWAGWRLRPTDAHLNYLVRCVDRSTRERNLPVVEINEPQYDSKTVEDYHVTFCHGFPPSQLEAVCEKMGSYHLTSEDLKIQLDSDGNPVYEILDKGKGTHFVLVSCVTSAAYDKAQLEVVGQFSKTGWKPKPPHITTSYIIVRAPQTLFQQYVTTSRRMATLLAFVAGHLFISALPKQTMWVELLIGFVWGICCVMVIEILVWSDNRISVNKGRLIAFVLVCAAGCIALEWVVGGNPKAHGCLSLAWFIAVTAVTYREELGIGPS